MRILIVIIISVTPSVFQSIQNNNLDSQTNHSIQRLNIVNHLNLQQTNLQVDSFLKLNEIQQNLQGDPSNNSKQIDFTHSVSFWYEKPEDDQFSQEFSGQYIVNYAQQSSEEQSIQSDSSTHQSRLAKYIQIEQVDLQQQSQTQEIIIQNTIPQVEEKNPLKLLLLYSNNVKLQNRDDDQHQINKTNEQILDQLEQEKQEKISKMQSLIIEQLKDKKPELKQEESFLEQNFIEWEMKSLINNNNLRAK